MAQSTLRRTIQAVLGFSVLQGPPIASTREIDDGSVVGVRRVQGGQLAPPPQSITRWYHADLETAIRNADRGWMAPAARLWRACKTDGVIKGVLSTRTSGLVRLPKKFRGRPDIVAALKYGTDKKGPQGPRSTFDEMCPPAELEMLADDGVGVGVGIGELVEVVGRDFPVLVRHDPEQLFYVQTEDRWYFNSIAGLLPINPGDGKWVLHLPGGRVAPWQNGAWRAVGRAYIDKDHARNYHTNWQGKLANPARVARAPMGATDQNIEKWFLQVAAWGVNTVFAMKPGYEVDLVESNGIGWKSFETAIERAEREAIIAIAGQVVTTDGGTGFANADIHKSIRADLIKATADALAYTLNTQVIPYFVAKRFGIDAVEESAIVEWDVEPAKDAAAAANSMLAAAQALTALRAAFDGTGINIDFAEFCLRFGIPVAGDVDGDGAADIAVPAAEKKPENDTDLSDFELDEAA